MEECKPQIQLEEHKWLQQLVGNWTMESEAVMGPDQPTLKSTGKESVRTIGGIWFLGEGEMTMPDGDPATTLITLGYDPKKGKYIGTWVGSMMNHLWVYSGTMSDDKKTLMLDAEGESMAGDGTIALYRDSITIVGADHRTMTSQMRDDKGNWTQFMEARYTRVK